jgi:hypothetical protein
MGGVIGRLEGAPPKDIDLSKAEQRNKMREGGISATKGSRRSMGASNRCRNDWMAYRSKLGCHPAGSALDFLGEKVLRNLRKLDLTTDWP